MDLFSLLLSLYAFLRTQCQAIPREPIWTSCIRISLQLVHVIPDVSRLNTGYWKWQFRLMLLMYKDITCNQILHRITCSYTGNKNTMLICTWIPASPQVNVSFITYIQSPAWSKWSEGGSRVVGPSVRARSSLLTIKYPFQYHFLLTSKQVFTYVSNITIMFQIYLLVNFKKIGRALYYTAAKICKTLSTFNKVLHK